MDLIESNGLVKQRHPWELARADFFNHLILQGTAGKPIRVLDVGCGDAWFARQLFPHLASSSAVVGWDIALTDDLLSVYRTGLPTGISLTRDEPQGLFDWILCMDVIEHVPDDIGFLSNIRDRYLRPEGRLLCTVPAWMSLFSTHDVELKHYRRYSPKAGVKTLKSAGFRVCRKGGLFHSLACVRGMQVICGARAKPLADPLAAPTEDRAIGLAAWNASTFLTRGVHVVLKLEGVISRAASALRLEFPGLSWWAVCEKV